VTSVYLIERADGSGYRRVSRSRLDALIAKPFNFWIFEGVDGDEEADTVTYFYRRRTEDDER
jgi:hypothetical protein